MQIEAETLCEIWEEEMLLSSTPCQLYSLAPLGIGTPLVESLTSYISRLAAAHSVLPRTLVTKMILPRLKKSHLYNDGYPVYDHLTTFWKHSSVLNGASGTTGDWVQTLEQLTQRYDLHFLTFLSFANTISCRNLMRSTQSWCPLCYAEWKATKQIVYLPLLWHFSIVDICPIHNQYLHTCCSYCGKALSPLTSSSLPGYCSHCKNWLGTSSGQENKKQHTSEEKQYQISTIVGGLLATTPILTELPSLETLPMIITTYVNNALDGNYSLFARQLQVHRRTAWEWGQGSQIPQLNTLLQLSFYFEVFPIDLLMGNIPENVLSQAKTDAKTSLSKETKRVYRHFESNKIRKALESVLQEKTDPPPSMREVAKLLQYDESHLHKHFPDLCQRISARYLTHQKEQRSKRLQKICNEVEQVVQSLQIQGYLPSERRVGQRLRLRGILKEQEVRSALADMRVKEG